MIIDNVKPIYECALRVHTDQAIQMVFPSNIDRSRQCSRLKDWHAKRVYLLESLAVQTFVRLSR